MFSFCFWSISSCKTGGSWTALQTDRLRTGRILEIKACNMYTQDFRDMHLKELNSLVPLL